jgi:hypothetical protein
MIEDDGRGGKAEKNWEERQWEKFAKWQRITRDHLGATSNLILGLATGLLAFASPRLPGQKVHTPATAAFDVAACLFFVLSITLALSCALNRLSDFRETTKIARPDTQKSPMLEELREKNRIRGERTWDLFKAQVFCFAIGALSLAIETISQIVGC